MTPDRRTLLRTASGLYLVITAPRLPHEALARAAVARRVPVIQLREKGLPDREFERLARSLREATEGTDTLFIVNDRPDIAALVGADGVHVGSDDALVGACRLALGPQALVGASVRTVDEALAARAAGADYVGAGPVFATATKPDAGDPIGLLRVAEIAAAVPDVPIVGIGGIDHLNAGRTVRAGARFVAVISAVCQAADPLAALDALVASTRVVPSQTQEERP